MGLKKRKKPFRCPLGLFDTEKKGTIILGCYRSGSHFVERAIQEHASSHGIEVLATGETLPQDAELVEISSFLNEDSKYKTTIINHNELKMAFLNDPSLVQHYHIVRTTQRNIRRWFLSFYILHNPHSPIATRLPLTSNYVRRKDSARINGIVVDVMINGDQAYYYDPDTGRYLGSWHRHNGHSVDPALTHMTMNDLEKVIQSEIVQQVREKFLQTYMPVCISLPEINQVYNQSMFGQFLSSLIPVDKEIDYSDMSSIDIGHWKWKPETYLLSDVPNCRLFKNGEILDAMLNSWVQPINGAFRNTHEPK